MKNKLAIRIQANEKRMRWGECLVNWLIEDGCRQGQIRSIIDFGNNGLWGNAKKTLESYGSDDTHLLVLQDDILPCRDLVATAEKLIELLPNEPISLFSNKDQINFCRKEGIHWLKVQKWLMAQAYIMPVEIIKDFLTWEEKHIDPKIYFDDNRWAMYFYYHKRFVWCTAPSLVEHIGWNDTTLTGYNPGATFEPRLRMAKWFLGFENSGLNIDWADLRAVEAPQECNADFCHYYKN